jgi:methanogenic corrinoid protein MtbC1
MLAMNAERGTFTAALIDATRRAWAAAAVARLRERLPSGTSTLGAVGGRDAAIHFEGLLEHLSVALQFSAAELFHEHVRWMCAAFAGRGISLDILRTTLECTRNELAERLPADSLLEVAPLFAEALRLVREPEPLPEGGLDGADPMTALAREYLLAALEGRRKDALELVLAAADRGTPISALQRDVVGRVQVVVGRMWHRGDMSVVEEHLVSRLSEQVLACLNPRMPRVTRLGRRVLVTGASGDLHDIGLRMVADEFEMAGWDPIFLGASAPAEDAARAALDFGVDLVALGAKLTIHVRPAAAMIALVRQEPRTRRLPVIVGGMPFGLVPALAARIGADGYATNAADAVALGNQLASRT